MSSSQHERPDNYYEAHIIEDGAQHAPEYNRVGNSQTKRKGSILSAILQVIFGVLLVLIGIPMLILPGPGLLSIAVGAMLAANGIRKIFSPAARAGA